MSAYWEDEYDDDYSDGYHGGAYFYQQHSPESWLSNLDDVRVDFFSMLSRAPGEIVVLRTALVMGQIDGMTYAGDCGACIIGTVAKARGVAHYELGLLDSNGLRPLEEFASAIRVGDTPDNNIYSRYFVQWIDEYLSIEQLSEESLTRE